MATIQLAVMTVPAVLYHSGVWPSPLACVVPTTGTLMLFGEAFGQVDLAPWQVGYAVAYPTLWVAALWWAGRAMFVRHVVAWSGGA
jgi:fluoroquinolone transport system permease protein